MRQQGSDLLQPVVSSATVFSVRNSFNQLFYKLFQELETFNIRHVVECVTLEGDLQVVMASFGASPLKKEANSSVASSCSTYVNDERLKTVI